MLLSGAAAWRQAVARLGGGGYQSRVGGGRCVRLSGAAAWRQAVARLGGGGYRSRYRGDATCACLGLLGRHVSASHCHNMLGTCLAPSRDPSPHLACLSVWPEHFLLGLGWLIRWTNATQ